MTVNELIKSLIIDDQGNYTCIKCGSIVFYVEATNSFMCSLSYQTNGKLCGVFGWDSSGDKKLIEIAKRQGII